MKDTVIYSNFYFNENIQKWTQAPKTTHFLLHNVLTSTNQDSACIYGEVSLNIARAQSQLVVARASAEEYFG